MERRASQGGGSNRRRRLGGIGSGPGSRMNAGILGQCWEWFVVVFWFLVGAVSNVVVLVPGAGYPGEARKEILAWFRVALIWLGDLEPV